MTRAPLILLLALGACSSVEPPPRLATELRTVAPQVPPELLEPCDIPTPGPMIRQSEVGGFLLDLDAALRACKARHDGLRQLLAPGLPK